VNDRKSNRDQSQVMSDDLREQPEEQQLASDTMTEERATGGGLSTADMARAMEQHGDDGRSTTESMSRETGSTSRQSMDSQHVEPLFPGSEANNFRTRWTEIQTYFVDEPRQAVERADELVAEVIQRLAQVFAEERQNLESQWGQGDSADTEGLRVALRRYRSFFERLLSA
jgi:hypothetical protein